jgi:hypothetical protein
MLFLRVNADASALGWSETGLDVHQLPGNGGHLQERTSCHARGHVVMTRAVETTFHNAAFAQNEKRHIAAGFHLTAA